MTEDQIERRVEKVVDALDGRLLNGLLSQADYEWEVRNINGWADMEYVRMAALSDQCIPRGWDKVEA